MVDNSIANFIQSFVSDRTISHFHVIQYKIVIDLFFYDKIDSVEAPSPLKFLGKSRRQRENQIALPSCYFHDSHSQAN